MPARKSGYNLRPKRRSNVKELVHGPIKHSCSTCVDHQGYPVTFTRSANYKKHLNSNTHLKQLQKIATATANSILNQNIIQNGEEELNDVTMEDAFELENDNLDNFSDEEVHFESDEEVQQDTPRQDAYYPNLLENEDEEVDDYDGFNFESLYGVNSPTIEVKKSPPPRPDYKSKETKEFISMMQPHTLTDKFMADLLKYLKQFPSMKHIPRTKEWFKHANEYHFPTFKKYKKKIHGKMAYFHSVEEILYYIVNNLENYDDLIWERQNDTAELTHESDFLMWDLIDPKNGKKTLMLKLFVDEYETTQWHKKKNYGIYISLANFTPENQQDSATKFVIAVLPENINDREIFYSFIYELFVKSVKNMMNTGLKTQVEEFNVRLHSILGDTPGINEMSGIGDSVSISAF